MGIAWRMKAILVAVAALILAAGNFNAARSADEPAARGSSPGFESDWEFLAGDWLGAGGGRPGQGGGSFSFRYDLDKKILVRRNHNELTGNDGKKSVHDDLMIVHSSEGSHHAKAEYYDNEGFVITYDVTISYDKNSWIFISPVSTSSPRFRLTYTKTADNTVGIKFEIAQPNAPEKFQVYLTGKARKKTG